MLVTTRFRVPEAEGEAFLADARRAVEALAGRPGFRSGRVGRAVEDVQAWVLHTEWAGVGAYRRALSAYEVKLHATPLLGRAIDEPSAYEVLYAEGEGAVAEGVSARAADASTAVPGQDLS